METDRYGRSVEFLMCPLCDNSGYCEPNVVCPFAKIYGYHISDPDIAPPDDSFVFDDLPPPDTREKWQMNDKDMADEQNELHAIADEYERVWDMNDKELVEYDKREEARTERDRRKNAEEWYRRRGIKSR